MEEGNLQTPLPECHTYWAGGGLGSTQARLKALQGLTGKLAGTHSGCTLGVGGQGLDLQIPTFPSKMESGSSSLWMFPFNQTFQKDGRFTRKNCMQTSENGIIGSRWYVGLDVEGLCHTMNDIG